MTRVTREFKTVFAKIDEAKEALANDGLGCVYVRADNVFVVTAFVTAFGSGVFARKDWVAWRPPKLKGDRRP